MKFVMLQKYTSTQPNLASTKNSSRTSSTWPGRGSSKCCPVSGGPGKCMRVFFWALEVSSQVEVLEKLKSFAPKDISVPKQFNKQPDSDRNKGCETFAVRFRVQV